MNESTKRTPDLIAYQVTEVKDQSYWNRIGAAWKTQKGGYRIRLTALPVDGEIVLHPPKTGEQ